MKMFIYPSFGNRSRIYSDKYKTKEEKPERQRKEQLNMEYPIVITEKERSNALGYHSIIATSNKIRIRCG